MRLASYQFSVEYVKGKLNIADPSSRLCESEPISLTPDESFDVTSFLQSAILEISHENDLITSNR